VLHSVAGHQIPFFPGLSLGIYPSSKHAMTATCEALRHDAKNAGRKMRVTVGCNIAYMIDLSFHSDPCFAVPRRVKISLVIRLFSLFQSISPGAVRTEMNAGEFAPDMAMNMLTPEEVAKTVTFVLSMPKSAEVSNLW